MSKVAIFFLLSTLVLAKATSTCGSGPAVSSFETDVFNTIPTDAPGYSAIQSAYTAWKATTATAFVAANFPSSWATYFTGQNICCTADTLTMFVSILKMHFGKVLGGVTGTGTDMSIMGAKKMDPVDAVMKQINDQNSKCLLSYLSAHPPPSTSTNVNTTASITSAPSVPASILAIMTALNAEETKIQVEIKLGFATVAKSASQMFRGTKIALCVDPDSVPAAIWSNGVVALQSDIDKVTAGVQAGLNYINDALNRTVGWITYQQKLMASDPIIPCDISAIVYAFAAKANICPSDTNCTATAKSFITSAWTVPALQTTLSQDPPAAPTLRRLSSSSLNPSSTGVSAFVVNDNEDNSIVSVGFGETPATLQTENSAADAAISSAGPVNYSAALQVQTATFAGLLGFTIAAFAAFILALI